MCGGKLCPFLAKLITYNRCVVVENAHIMTRNVPTIGVYCLVATNGHLVMRNGPTIGV